VLKVGQNIKYDMGVFRRYGIEIGPVDDTMLLSFVLDAGKHNHGMDELAERYLNQTTIKFSDVAGSGAKQVSFDKVPIDKARDYAAEDADVTLQLWAQFKPRIVAEHMSAMYETIERPLIPVLLSMEQAGIKVDAPQLVKLSADFEKRLIELETRSCTSSPAGRSMSARPSSWARSCSTSRSCPAASAPRTARG
jgi:DNA polymerase-1